MILIKHPVYGATFVAIVFVIVSFLCYKNIDKGEKYKNHRIMFLIQGMVLSFGITYLVLYYFSDNHQAQVVSNIITTEPDF